MLDELQSLLAYCEQDGRVCPQPNKWNQLWKLLPNRSLNGGTWEPSLPLILAAWDNSSNLMKMLRLREHIDWAHKNGAFSIIDIFLRELSETDWHHLND